MWGTLCKLGNISVKVTDGGPWLEIRFDVGLQKATGAQGVKRLLAQIENGSSEICSEGWGGGVHIYNCVQI